MQKKLIVNADDYGHTPGVSAGIRQAHLRGIVTSTSVMMNRPDAINAIQTTQKECPRLEMGVHLVITSGSPLLPPERLPGLVDSNGDFYKLPAMIAHLAGLNLAEVEAEWRAQIAAFVQVAGCQPDHLDSHHHISYYSPGLFEIMCQLADENDCGMRIPFGVEDTIFKNAGTLPQAAALKNFPHGYAQVFYDGFYDEGVTLENLQSILQTISSDQDHETFELMCHPALVDEDLRRVSIYNKRRGDELNLLQHPKIVSFIKEKEIQLIRFSDLT